MEQDPDVVVPPPAKPTQPGQTVLWFDTADGNFLRHGGLIGTVEFDEQVTLVVKRAGLGAGDPGLREMSSETFPANTPSEVAVPFIGARTRVELVTQNECDVWHVDGRITARRWWP